MTRNELATLSAFPFELLGRIFQLSTCRPKTLMALASVCHQWKDVVYQDSLLWTSIRITKKTKIRQLYYQLERSGSRGIDVGIAFTPGDISSTLCELCRIALADPARIERVRINSQRTFDADDNTYDEDDPDEWPPEIFQALAAGATWPLLRTLDLSADAYTGPSLEVHLVAPMLERLALNGVSARWESLGLGDALLSIDLRKSSKVDALVLAIANCPNLCRIDIDDDDQSDDPLCFVVQRSRPSLWADLEALSLTWHTLDVQSLLHVLACLPHLGKLLVDVADCQNHDEPLDANFQLRHLTTLHLTISASSSWRAMLCILLPAIRSARLQDLSLDGVDIGSCETILGPSLQKLDLSRLRGDAEELVNGLGQCQELQTLCWDDLQLSGLTASLEALRQPLPRLLTATFIGPESWLARGPLPDNQPILRLFLSLLRGHSIALLNIHAIPLATREMVHICSGIADGGPVSITLTRRPHRAGVDIRPMCLNLARRAPTCRVFEVDSVALSLAVLDASVGIFARISSLDLEVQIAVEVFTGIPAAAQLSALRQVTVQFGDTEPHEAHTAMETIVSQRGDNLDCPRLRNVTLNYDVHSIHLPLQVSMSVVHRFTEIFRSQRPIELTTQNVVLNTVDAVV